MPNYNQQHQFYADVDLHARSMFLHIVNAKSNTVFERDPLAGPGEFSRDVLGCPFPDEPNSAHSSIDDVSTPAVVVDHPLSNHL